MLTQMLLPRIIAIALCLGLTSCESEKDKVEICITLMQIKPSAGVEVTAFARDSAFREGNVYCRFETSSKVIEDIFVDPFAQTIVRKNILWQIQPGINQPEWWSSVDPKLNKWRSKPVHDGRYIREFLFIENIEGYTIFALAGSY